MLRPEDVEQKTFSTALRGYDLNEVDDFLDEITATLRTLYEQLEAARSSQPARPEPAAPAPAAASAEAPAAAVDESAVGRVLIAAQETADRIVAEANAEAERILAQARTEADTWATERDEARRAAEQEMAELTSRVHAVRRELARLASEVADSLDRMDEAISGTAAATATEAGTSGVPRHVSSDDDFDWGEDESPSLEFDGGEGTPDDAEDDLDDDLEDEGSDDEADGDDDLDEDDLEGDEDDELDEDDEFGFGSPDDEDDDEDEDPGF